MPHRLGKYLLLKSVGESMDNKVYSCIDQETEEISAIKVFILDGHDSKSKFEAYQTEVESLELLAHYPHIVTMLGKCDEATFLKSDGSSHKVCYIVMELLERDIFDYVSMTDTFPAPILRHILKQLLQAVSFMHSQGYVHRDIKLENCCFDKDYNIRLCDFSSASAQHKDGLLHMNTMKGTQGYMAPEMLSEGIYKGRDIDIFALGVLLFTLRTKSAPFVSAELKDRAYRLFSLHQFEELWKSYESNFKS